MNCPQAMLQELISHYISQGAPSDQQMLIMLLREAQEAGGGTLSLETLRTIAEACRIKESILTALIRRLPSLRLNDAPHRLEICGTCGKSHILIEYIQKNHDSKALGFSLHVTGCMKNCRQGPSIRWDGTLHSRVTPEILNKLFTEK